MKKHEQKHCDDRIIIPKYVVGGPDGRENIPEDLKKVIDYFKDCGNRNYQVCLVGEKESVRRNYKNIIPKGKEFIHFGTQSLNEEYAFLPISVKNSIRRINKLVSNPDNDFNKGNVGIHTLGLVAISEIKPLNDAGYGITTWNSIEVFKHCKETVLIPPTMLETDARKTIVDLAANTPDLSTLVAVLKAGGLVDTLSSKGPFTVFAPTNEAFAKLPKATLASLLKPENKAKLVDILTYHVAAGAEVFSKDLKNGEQIKTVEGKVVTAHVSSAGVEINDATVTTADVAASNGVVHIIDTVLIPPGSSA